jgi:hypothetical protein
MRLLGRAILTTRNMPPTVMQRLATGSSVSVWENSLSFIGINQGSAWIRTAATELKNVINLLKQAYSPDKKPDICCQKAIKSLR